MPCTRSSPRFKWPWMGSRERSQSRLLLTRWSRASKRLHAKSTCPLASAPFAQSAGGMDICAITATAECTATVVLRLIDAGLPRHITPRCVLLFTRKDEDADLGYLASKIPPFTLVHRCPHTSFPFCQTASYETWALKASDRFDFLRRSVS